MVNSPLLFAGRGRNDLDHTFSVNALVPMVRFKYHKREKKIIITTQSRQKDHSTAFMTLQQSQNWHFSTVTVVLSYVFTVFQLPGRIPLSSFGPE